MIYTGYFAKMKHYDGIVLSIANVSPENVQELRCFAPTNDLIRDWKQGIITQNDYILRYNNETLNKVDVDSLNFLIQMSQYNNVFLCCYERPTDFCHRHIVAWWLNNYYNLNVSEFIIK